MITDQVSDFLTRVRNAGSARLLRADVVNTKMNRNLAEIFVREGFLKSFKEVNDGKHTQLRLYLRFEGGDLKKPVIQGLKRVSRPGLRRYVHATKLPRVMSGFGLAILSTSKGVVTDRDAKKLGIGGEHLCSIW